jgi:transcriptional regulator with XRE-family HTH domain
MIERNDNMTEEVKDIQIRIASHLKELRTIFNLNQRQLAKQLGIARSTLSNVEIKGSKNRYILTRQNMILSAFVFKNELKKRKSIIKKIEFKKKEDNYSEVVKQLKKANVSKGSINNFLEKYGKRIIKKNVNTDKEADMNFFMVSIFFESLFNTPENIGVPGDYIDDKLFYEIIEGLINHIEFKLIEIYFNKKNTFFSTQKNYDFDPYKFMDYVNGKEV